MMNFPLSADQQAAACALVAAANPPFIIDGMLVLTPIGVDPGQLGSPTTMSTIWFVEDGFAYEFLTAPAVQQYVQNGIFVICVFESGKDRKRCRRALAARAANA